MTTDLSNIKIGELFSALIIVLSLIFVIYELYTKLSNIYNNAYKVKNKKENAQGMLKRHDDELKMINSKLDTIICKLDMQDKRTNESNVVNFKYDLYKIYEKCKAKQCVTQEELKCYLEKEKIYLESGGNDFIHEKIHPAMMEFKIK